LSTADAFKGIHACMHACMNACMYVCIEKTGLEHCGCL